MEYPPQLSPEHERDLLAIASDYSLSHGLVLRPLSHSTTTSIHAPYSLYPSPFPRQLFEQALRIQESYNRLYAKITTDDQFLERVVGGNVTKVDEFQRNLYRIWKQVKQEGVKQPISLGIFRSDYLVHAPQNQSQETSPSLKQVEFNTISSSFGALSTRVSQLHQFLVESQQYPSPHPYLSNPTSLPENEALEGIAQGLVDAHYAYKNETGSKDARIMMVIQDNERNAFDQRLLQWQVMEKHKVPLIRIPFSQLRTSLSLSPSNSALLYTPPTSSPSSPSASPIEISLIYYRTAYSPSDYYTPHEWSTRLLIEQSLAIKCPSVAMQLAGCKKVQQVLSTPSELERFIEGEEEREELRKSFVGLWGMEDGNEGEELARGEPERFVLKPQREGGGNNIYRQDIPPFLSKLEEEDKTRGEGEVKGKEGYILMELIEPPRGMTQVLVKAGEEEGRRADVVSELGIYGVMLLKEKKEEEGGGCEELRNETVGHLLRTKGRESDEGGIAVGFSVLDSPVLV
ncbi:glutathione synthase [Sporobolomyces salmoneus]|uniref:glutathione synthase n=1 Tax=Sporobolomyces salmoneus TaxID=183962 RepID=UPI00317CA9C0